MPSSKTSVGKLKVADGNDEVDVVDCVDDVEYVDDGVDDVVVIDDIENIDYIDQCNTMQWRKYAEWNAINAMQ